MRVTKGLIIADPWIGYVLGGTKDWEMRASGASHRGWFGLIRKGTGAVYGVARLIEVGAPLAPAEMIATFEHHRIPEDMIRSGEVAKWNTPWKLADVRRLDRPVPYRHKSGAVTWVELDDAAIAGIASQFEAEATATNPAMPMAAASRRDRFGSAETVKVDVSQRGQKLHIDIERDDGKPGVAAPAGMSPSAATVQAARPLKRPATAASRSAAGRVVGEVEITDGNITNNHIYLRSFFDRFPADAIGGSNKATRAKRDLTIDWGGGEPVQTDLDGQKKFFRARGWIGAFYQLHRARTGDRVVVEEVAPYRYRVSLKRYGLQGRAS
ncbi:hypothetical protein HGG72_14400 [Ochrobactrum pecoris]|uniref:ASCH domain-containing protein n=1 Tax=Brucella pecoris TaxID=867683 RepID=A0A5C5CD97_9HYPH|nr:hypothetical protein [Brucella pecoris]MBB4095522.1 hypothetical protein [Brucella pecoris]NKW81240.1 hypothetical protein [Brucella pecoris]TNV09297.1 hypothetical protein FIB18_21305 [Brucella pecoris]